MNRLSPLACLLLQLFAVPMFAADPYQQELSTALVNRVLFLRNSYTDSKLTFDSNGTLSSKGTSGFGPGEGRIYVKSVQLERGKLTLAGGPPSGRVRRRRLRGSSRALDPQPLL